MNIEFTPLDRYAERKGLSKFDNAKIAAEKAIFDAILYDGEFRNTAKELYAKRNVVYIYSFGYNTFVQLPRGLE